MDDVDRDVLNKLVDNLTRVVRVESALADHTRHEEIFQNHVEESLREISVSVSSLAAEHVSAKGWAKGFVFAAMMVGFVLSDVGRSMINFLHGLIK